MVTNWHNVTGRDPQTLQCLSKFGGTPDNLQLEHHYNPLGPYPALNVQLYDDADQNCPRWLVHSGWRRKVDVIALPVSTPANAATMPINTLDSAPSLREWVGQDVFVLGYPRGMTGGSHLPLWKRGTIASEPMIDQHNLPMFLIDTATREGMSGAPVIARSWSGAYKTQEGPTSAMVEDHNLELPTKFIGIYSGRVSGAADLEAQIGIVWKARVIDEIIADGSLGRPEDVV